MRVLLPLAALSVSLGLALAACAAAPPQTATAAAPAPEERQCDAGSLGWALGKVADDTLVTRAQKESGASTVRVLRPGVMVTNEFNGMRLNIRVDNERRVLATSCG